MLLPASQLVRAAIDTCDLSPKPVLRARTPQATWERCRPRNRVTKHRGTRPGITLFVVIHFDRNLTKLRRNAD